MKQKARIAFDIVRRFHGEELAKVAEQTFNNTFTKGGVPEDIQEIHIDGAISLADLLVQAKIVPSKTEWRRLVEAGGIKLEDDTKVTDPNFKPEKGTILKIGKRRFVKIV